MKLNRKNIDIALEHEFNLINELNNGNMEEISNEEQNKSCELFQNAKNELNAFIKKYSDLCIYEIIELLCNSFMENKKLVLDNRVKGYYIESCYFMLENII